MEPTAKINGKTPTTGIQPVGSSVGLGVSPTHSAPGHFVAEMPYRMCEKANGITYPIAICMVCKKIIEPASKEFSRTGSHGKFYYVHDHPLTFIILEQSNSGKRRIKWVSGYVKVLNEVVEYAWVINGQSIDEVIKIIETSIRVM
jgi:hypothetical protein